MRPSVAILLLAAAWAAAGTAPAGRAAAPRQEEPSAADLGPRLDRLDAGIRAAEAVRAVKRLQYAYGHYLDMGLWDDLADLVTEGVEASFPPAMVTGRANLRRHLMADARRTAPGLAEGQLQAHLLLQPVVTLGADGSTARGTWHELALTGQFGTAATWSGGIYDNEYVRERGVWRISRLRYYPQYGGAYADFGLKAPPRWSIPYPFVGAHAGVAVPASARRPAVSSPAVAVAPRLAGLSQRVARLADETAVQNLQHSFGYYLDRKMWDDVADLFVDQGSLDLARQGVYVGRARIRRALDAVYGPSPLRYGELFDHLTLGTIVTVAGDGRTAAARVTQLSMLGRNGEFARWELGTYENEFVRQDGVWKIRTIRYVPRLTTDYDKGWASDARPAPGPLASFPPDRTAARATPAYPGIHYVGTHFVHPATGRPARLPAGSVTQVPLVSATLRGTPPRPGGEGLTVLAALEGQLDAAIAVDSVENLNSAYGYYLDEADWNQMADLFAVTAGAKEISGVGSYSGRDRIRTVLNLRGPRDGRSPAFFTIHQLTQPVVHVSDDGRSARARFRLWQAGGSADGSSGSWIGGIYENTAVLEDGEWKFGVQDLHHLFTAPIRTGWARYGAAAAGGRATRADPPPAGAGPAGAAAAASRLATEFPPDRPIRARQYAFPEIDEPAFHYTNPVSGRVPARLLR